MLRLSREVRFAINAVPDAQLQRRAANSFAGHPSITGLAHYFRLVAHLIGPLDARTQCLVDIKNVDAAVRERAVGMIESAIRVGRFGDGAEVVSNLFQQLRSAWLPAELDRLDLHLSPYLSLSKLRQEPVMLRVTQAFEFSASHRLHNPEMTDEENHRMFGKCNNPHGHGHNYRVEVSIGGMAGANGLVPGYLDFERIVAQTVIEPLDHKYLNVEIAQFADVIPTVENIARVVFQMLKAPLAAVGAQLRVVRVWETSKTAAEFSED